MEGVQIGNDEDTRRGDGDKNYEYRAEDNICSTQAVDMYSDNVSNIYNMEYDRKESRGNKFIYE